MRIQALTDKLREERTLSDAEFEELFAILSQGASGPCADQVRICDDIPQAVCSPRKQSFTRQPVRSGKSITAKTYICAASLSSPITAAMTAAIAASAGATGMLSATGSPKNRSWTAAHRGMFWDFGLLSCRAEKTSLTPMKKSAISSLPSAASIRTARSRSRSERRPESPIRLTKTPALTDTC